VISVVEISGANIMKIVKNNVHSRMVEVCYKIMEHGYEIKCKTFFQ